MSEPWDDEWETFGSASDALLLKRDDPEGILFIIQNGANDTWHWIAFDEVPKLIAAIKRLGGLESAECE